MADEFGKNCTICENETLGRYVKATEVIPAGETILLESPILILACKGDKRCCNCYRFAQQYCRKCSIAPLCLDCAEHNDEFDCNVLAAAGAVSLPDVRVDILKKHFDTYGLLQCLLLHENPQTRKTFGKMLQMEAHLEKRRNTKIWQEHDRDIVQPLLQSNIWRGFEMAPNINGDFLQKILAIWDVNSHEIRAPDAEIMRGLYPQVSLLAHNCCPNANQAIDDQYRMKVYANREIGRGEVVTNSYTNLLLGTDERRQILREGKYFHCTCARCEDPTELGSHMSSFICSACAGHKQESYIVKDGDSQTWKCQKCEHTLRPEQVAKILEKSKEEMFHAHGDYRRLEYLLAKLCTILHKNHYLVVDLKQEMANILRNAILNSRRPNRQLFERKIRLCQDLVLLLQTIQPGMTRLKGIALYEMATSHVKLQRLKFEENEMEEDDLKKRLKECLAMYRESIRMLSHEPPKTPEGQLLKNVAKEFDVLQKEVENGAQSEGDK
ncbi:SET domain-containing protein SmydA-8 [Musca domestica]|uniref:SET domain-containing protein SmydA-8 n=1 Tax=Musca domestica TaxID=7370 RepID=A0A9J7D0V6_MUSDO|nr:SET domain-containing protein SmydA-8 [Musca domestica]